MVSNEFPILFRTEAERTALRKRKIGTCPGASINALFPQSGRPKTPQMYCFRTSFSESSSRRDLLTWMLRKKTSICGGWWRDTLATRDLRAVRIICCSESCSVRWAENSVWRVLISSVINRTGVPKNMSQSKGKHIENWAGCNLGLVYGNVDI